LSKNVAIPISDKTSIADEKDMSAITSIANEDGISDTIFIASEDDMSDIDDMELMYDTEMVSKILGMNSIKIVLVIVFFTRKIF